MAKVKKKTCLRMGMRQLREMETKHRPEEQIQKYAKKHSDNLCVNEIHLFSCLIHTVNLV